MPLTLRRLAGPLALLALVLAPGAARASRTQESLFQDDDHLIYASPATVNRTLTRLGALGVDRIRVTVKWAAVAPDPLSRNRPAGFDAGDPGAYPARAWEPYDRVVELAARHGILVDFDVTAPGPLWAMKSGPPNDRVADHYAPSVEEWARFVLAVGRRYSGSYVPPAPAPRNPSGNPGGSTVPVPVPVPGGLLAARRPAAAGGRPVAPPAADPPVAGAAATGLPVPRVSFWTIWNEPNIEGWLSPQWVRSGRRTVPNSPRLYREYVDAAFGSLYVTGHTVGHDTILIGETAPEGHTHPTAYPEMEPMPFLRELYCVDGHYRPLRGRAARELGCPTAGGASAFARTHPGLFGATGWAHHPYYFFFAPSYISDNTGFVPLANLSRLEGGLDRLFRIYRVHRTLPIYLTEYGYQTNPPDPFQVVSPARQAAYLNEADWLAYRDPRVRMVSQFLLYDAPPNTLYAAGSPAYWATFQTGLLYASGRAKPAAAAYRMPIWVPAATVRRGGRLAVWGQLRPARGRAAQTAVVEYRTGGRGPYRPVAAVAVAVPAPGRYFTAAFRPASSGSVRIAWRPKGGHVERSRAVDVTVR